MPIWLRKFTFSKIKAWYDDQNEQNDKQYNKRKKQVTAKPNIKPTYSTKASNK